MGTVHAPSHIRDLPPESALHVQKHTGSLGGSSQPQHTAIPPLYIQIPKLQESQLSRDIFTDTLEPWCPLVTRATHGSYSDSSGHAGSIYCHLPGYFLSSSHQIL